MKIDATGDGDPSVTMGALYSSGAHITSAGNVGISSCHGRIAVHTARSTGSVNLSSVNGTAQVSTGVFVYGQQLYFLEQYKGCRDACLALSVLCLAYSVTV